MAVNKKPAVKAPLSMVEIVMRADVATIEAALQARRQIDALLAERAAAYERIAALEKQVNEVLGDDESFVFPPPPVPVAEFTAMAVATPAPAPAPAPAAPAASAPAHAPAAAPSASHSDSAPAKKSASSNRNDSK